MDLIADGQASKDEQLLVVTKNGFGKRTALSAYKIQGRGGSGIKTAQATTKTGDLAAARIVSKNMENEDMIIISRKGQVIRLSIKSISVLGRATQGVRIMKLDKGDELVGTVCL